MTEMKYLELHGDRVAYRDVGSGQEALLLIHGMAVIGNARGDHYGPVALSAPDERAAEQCEQMGQIIGELAVKLHG